MLISESIGNFRPTSVAGKNLENAWRVLLSIFGGPAVVTPQRIQAVYLPAWIIDAQLASKISVNDTQVGHTFRILSLTVMDQCYLADNWRAAHRCVRVAHRLHPPKN